MRINSFQFYVDKRYYPSHEVTNPYIMVRYEYFELTKTFLRVTSIEIPFYMFDCLLLSSNLREEIKEAAKQNFEKTMQPEQSDDIPPYLYHQTNWEDLNDTFN